MTLSSVIPSFLGGIFVGAGAEYTVKLVADGALRKCAKVHSKTTLSGNAELCIRALTKVAGVGCMYFGQKDNTAFSFGVIASCVAFESYHGMQARVHKLKRDASNSTYENIAKKLENVIPWRSMLIGTGVGIAMAQYLHPTLGVLLGSVLADKDSYTQTEKQIEKMS